ncbi:MAG: ribosomal protein S18-alanine N-acetyltransferase [bacterium]
MKISNNAQIPDEELPIKIRSMTVKDLDGVLTVERLSYNSPWRYEDFYREVVFNQLAFYYVAEIKQTICGFVGMWLIVDEAHITNIAVHPEFRRRKIGERLLLHAIEEAQRRGAKRVVLEVRVSNYKAQNLYLKYDFRYAGVRRNYYRDNNEDAFLMVKELK